MTFLEDLKENWEKLKNILGVSWQNLVRQLPDPDRRDDYYYDEYTQTWILKSTALDSDKFVLDSDKNLKVSITDKLVISGKVLANENNYAVYDLGFIADSVTISFFQVFGDGNTIVVYYDYNITGITLDTENRDSVYSNTSIGQETIQFDCKPFGRFGVNFIGVTEGEGSYEYIIIFHKQKKTKISDITYASSWNAVVDVAPSKNAVYDKIVAMIIAYTNLNHNDLKNINAGVDYEHITQTQKDALHGILTNLNQLVTRNHSDLQNKNLEANIKHLTDAQVGALHSVLTNLTDLATRNHNDLLNINAGTDYEHITQIQVDALHSVLTNLTQLTTRNHSDLQNKNLEDNIKHLTDVQVGALHSVLTNLTQLATRNHNDLLNINAGDLYEHITQTQKSALHPAVTISDVDYNEGTWNENTDGATKNAIRDKIESLGGGGGSDKGSMALVMDLVGNAVKNTGIPNYIDTSETIGSGINSRFRITANMSALHDIKLILSIRERSGGTDPTFTWNVGAYKTDGSEYVGGTYNIANAVAFSVDGEGYIITRTYTIANVYIDQNDVVLIFISTTNIRRSQIYSLDIEFTEVV